MSTTTNYGFNEILPSDYVSASSLNSNWESLDSYALCHNMETFKTTLTDSTNITVTWYIKQFGAKSASSETETTVTAYYEMFAYVSGIQVSSTNSQITIPLPISVLKTFIERQVSLQCISDSSFNKSAYAIDVTPSNDFSNVMISVGSTESDVSFTGALSLNIKGMV